jgi:TonB family protein
MSTMHERARFFGVALASLAAHGALLWTLEGDAHATKPKQEPVRVSFKTAPLPPLPEAAAEPAPEMPRAEARPKQRAKREAPRKLAANEPPPSVSKPLDAPAPANEPLDFTGVTLTSTTGAGGFSAVVGNGEHMNGALAPPPRGTRTGRGAGAEGEGQGKGRPGSPVVGLERLSRPPRAPSLDDALLAHYPRAAREQGQPGRAVVRARILPDGRVGETRVLMASAPEFGRACQATLNASRWSAPLDEQGRPVATEVSYACQFEVTR